MAQNNRIKTAFERQTRAVELRPGMGQGTAVTKVRVRNGLTCDIEEGPWKLVADNSEKWGGNGEGPTPGTLGRGALGSCLAIAYMMWAARLEVPVNNLEIEVHADYDTRGMVGAAGVRPGYGAVRYVVKVESPAPAEVIQEWLDTADKHCPYLDVFSNDTPVEREVRIETPID